MIIVDAHVHIHPNFNLTQFLDSTSNNFEKIAIEKDCKDSYGSVICLTESFGINRFSEFYSEPNSFGDWKFLRTNELNSLKAVKKDKHPFFIIAGRQIVTLERLEVLALGVVNQISDNKPIKEVIKFVQEKNCLPVIPWGVGKWIGNRGRIIKDLVSYDSHSVLLLGDNGNRPAFWKKSSIFDIGEKNNKKNLPGSDPLPFVPEQEKSGSFGFMLDGSLDEQFPFKVLHEKIINSKGSFKTFGKNENLFRFVKNQAAMQFVKRSSKLDL